MIKIWLKWLDISSVFGGLYFWHTRKIYGEFIGTLIETLILQIYFCVQ